MRNNLKIVVSFGFLQEDVTPKRVVEIVEMLRKGEKLPVSGRGCRLIIY